jgi:DNA-binding NarL/FixJ family response regulator
MSIKVLITDDHAIVRKGLSFYLSAQEDIELVGEAEHGQDAIEKVSSLSPDVVLMDLMMPIMDGIAATRHIRSSYPNIKVIVLTTFSDQDHVVPAIKAGANGYLLKDVQPDELVKAIRLVSSGQTYLHPVVTEQIMAHLSSEGKAITTPPDSDGTPTEALTEREKEVLQLIAQGRSNKEIAADIHITEKTVKTHVSHILSKLRLADRTQAAIYAVKRGWDKDTTSNLSD